MANLPLANGLTPRKAEVVRLMSLGCDQQQIAAILKISVSAVSGHKDVAMKTLGTNKAALVTRLAIKHKISTLDDSLSPAEARAAGTRINKSTKRPQLTPRLASIVRLVSLGCTANEIAALLDIAPTTARNNRMEALKALGTNNSVALTRAALGWNFTTMSDKLTATEKRKSGRKDDGWN